MILGPTFSEPAECARAMHVPHFSVRAEVPKADSAPGACPWTINAIRGAAKQAPFAVGLIYICSPNNPTGTTVSPAFAREVASALAPARVLYDRSFETVRDRASSRSSALTAAELFQIERARGVLELRSFTKDFAVPGLRLGALFGDEEDISRCLAQLPPWSVSSMAAAAALAILERPSLAFLERSRERWWNDAVELRAALRTRGFTPLPSAVPFGLVHVGDGAAFRHQLLEHRVHVRDCGSFGLPEYVRLCARGEDARARLMDVIDKNQIGPSQQAK